MNIIVTAEVTYEIQDVKDLEQAISIFQTCVTSEARHMEGVTHCVTKNLFATEMNDDMTFDTNPQIWEVEEVA